jgi:hypothetical protein
MIIKTYQDLINALNQIEDKNQQIKILVTNDGFDGMWFNPISYDITIEESKENNKKQTIIQFYR